MRLQELKIKSLLDLHNTLADVQAGPKSFATKSKLIARIESIAVGRGIDLALFGQPGAASTADQRVQSLTGDTAAADFSPETRTGQTGKGIGRLARELLLDPAGHPHALIAEMVNARVEGAQATSKSVRWYACSMRKDGVEVPKRLRRVTKKEEVL